MSIGNASRGERNKRIGVAILKLLVENALKNIPLYGFYLGIGIDILKVVKAEIDKDRPLTEEEILEAFIYKRIGKPTEGSGCFWAFAEASFIVLIGSILGTHGQQFLGELIGILGVPLALCIHFVIAPRVWTALPREVRKFIKIAGI